ncbi:MAG: hypothetical protein LBL74_07450 [Bacteroidales bacterium]|jgi:hypothetical protein|nr:hypothetical protein [Bacteroidales bacterium]
MKAIKANNIKILSIRHALKGYLIKIKENNVCTTRTLVSALSGIMILRWRCERIFEDFFVTLQYLMQTKRYL